MEEENAKKIKISKKTKILIISILIIIGLITFFVVHEFSFETNMFINWNVVVPRNNKQEFKTDYTSEKEIINYTVISYDDLTKIDSKITWSTKQIFTHNYDNYNEVMNDVYNKITVDDKYKIEYDKCLYNYKKKDNSELFMYLNREKKMVYFIEILELD